MTVGFLHLKNFFYYYSISHLLYCLSIMRSIPTLGYSFKTIANRHGGIYGQ